LLATLKSIFLIITAENSGPSIKKSSTTVPSRNNEQGWLHIKKTAFKERSFSIFEVQLFQAVPEKLRVAQN
jgi:hypothetical protein